jgi:hypothetical protein
MTQFESVFAITPETLVAHFERYLPEQIRHGDHPGR